MLKNEHPQTAINTACAVGALVAQSEGANPEIKQETIDRVTGEAKFLRALSYFNLVRLFGGVPLKTTPTIGYEDSQVPRNTVDAVYEQIIADLTAAHTLLPEVQAEKGRATNGAAAALLAKVYLTRAGNTDDSPYWQQSKDWAKKVIDSGLYQLEPIASDLFEVGAKNSVESIFEVQFANGGDGNGNALPKLTTPSRSGLAALGTGWGSVRLQKKIYDDFVTKYPNDYRINSYIIHSSYVKTDGSATKIYPLENNAQNNGWPFLNKYKDPDALNNAEHGANFMYLRYADVLLMYAEAENEINGPTNEAYNAIDELLARARNTPDSVSTSPANWQHTLSKEEFRQEVLNERQFELIGEVHFWYDLIRKGEQHFLDYLNAYNNHPTLSNFDVLYDLTDDHYKTRMLLPIPQEEITTNSAISSTDQNPGY
mgnify:CR=1 FL=1